MARSSSRGTAGAEATRNNNRILKRDAILRAEIDCGWSDGEEVPEKQDSRLGLLFALPLWKAAVRYGTQTVEDYAAL